MQLSAAPPRPQHERGCLSSERLLFGKLRILKRQMQKLLHIGESSLYPLQHNCKRMSPAYKCRTPKISLHTKVSGDAVLPWQHSPRRVILVRPFHSLSITISLWSNWGQHPVGLLKPCSVTDSDPTSAQVDIAISSLSTTLPMSYTLQHSWACLIT